MVDRDYMLRKPRGPSAPKLFLDTRVVPAVVNVLGGAEVALDRASRRTGVPAAGLLAGAAGLGSLGIAWLLFGRRPQTEPAAPLAPAGRRQPEV